MHDNLDFEDLLSNLTETSKEKEGPHYEDPIIIFGSNGDGKCCLIDILNKEKIDDSFWDIELDYFFEDEDFKFEPGVFKCTLYCKSWLCRGAESEEYDYEVNYVQEPEKLYTWI